MRSKGEGGQREQGRRTRAKVRRLQKGWGEKLRWGGLEVGKERSNEGGRNGRDVAPHQTTD